MMWLTTTATQKTGRRFDLLAFGCLLLTLQPWLPPRMAEAATPASNELPTGGTVTSGQANFVTTSNQLNVNQSTQQAIINWNSFNVGSQAQVNFVQPNSSSQTLNRVMAGDASQIYGKITANGHIILINPNGVVFGNGSQVNAGGLVASTLDISDENFKNNRWLFERNGATGTVTNQGELTAAAGGYVGLIGSKVVNQGKINTPSGKALLIAGETVEMPLTQSGLIGLNVTASLVDASVSNDSGGTITASGGTVQMAAEAVSGKSASITNKGTVTTGQAQVATTSGSFFVDTGSTITAENIDITADVLTGMGNFSAQGSLARLTINTGYLSLSGALKAQNTSGTGGTINIAARDAVMLSNTSAVTANGTTGGSVKIISTNGYVLVSGAVQATGSTGKGGTVEISGATATALLAGKINASGATGGGTIHIGGGWHGAGTLNASTTTSVDTASTITADATTSGNGGEVVLWSTTTTNFYGNITARGGSIGGNGGQVELSSAGVLNVLITSTHGVNVLALNTHGTTGTVTLDPLNIIIGDSPGVQSIDIFKALLSTSGVTSSAVSLSSLGSGSLLGTSVALSDNYALIGASGVSSNRGNAYLYNLITGAWTDLATTTNQPITALAGYSYFGTSVALSSTYALIGAKGVSSSQGDAFLYNLSSGTWTDLATTSSQPITALAASSSFGTSVALNSTYALIGASDVTSYQGNAYLYKLSDGTWLDLATTSGQPITGLGTNSYFGNSVALNGTYALIGAYGITSSRGNAYLYNLSDGTWTDLTQTSGQLITALAPASAFGTSVALNDTFALIGASGVTSSQGNAYLYKLSDGTWLDLATTSGQPITGLGTNSSFGTSVALNSTYALIGAKGITSSRGDALLYNLSDGTWTNLGATSGQPISALSSNAYFGTSVALNSTYALIGASGVASSQGNAYLYNLTSGTWTDLASTFATTSASALTIDSLSNFGSSLAIDNTYALIGANGVLSGRGDAYLYNLVTGAWTDLATTSGQLITALDPSSYFGSSVALNSTYALIGASGVSSDRGGAYLYNLTNGTWLDLATTSSQPITALAASSYFGNSVALNSTYALIGAHNPNSLGNAYLYNLTSGTWLDLATTSGQPITALGASSSFGISVALNSTYALIGATSVTSSRGDAFLYNLTNGTWLDLATTSGQPITALGASSSFGYSVALNDTYALIGASGVSSDRGGAYLYNLTNGTWLDLATTSSQPVTALAASSYFGYSVALNSTYALIGATGVTSSRGDAYLYNLTNGTWTDLATTPSQLITSLSAAGFGSSVALNDTYALIGAPNANDIGFAYLVTLAYATNTTSYISSSTIQTGLAGGNYKIISDNNISITNLVLSAIDTGNSLTLEAGNSIDISSAVVFGSRTVNLIANAANADLGSSTNRASGAAGITIENEGSINNGTGALTLQIGTAASTGRTGAYALAGNFTINGAITTGSLFINGAESAINITSALTASNTGYAVTLNGLSETFSGAGALRISFGNWRIFNTNSSSLGTVQLIGLMSGTYRYGCTYSGGCTTGAILPTNNNTIIYAYAPTVALASYVGTTNKVYDATNAVNISSSVITGAVNGETLTLTYAYSTKNAGTNVTINYSLAESYGYILSGAALTGNITQATIGVTGVAAVNKVYDATIAASLNNSSAALSGILGTDTVTLDTTAAAALFADKNVGTAKTVTASGYALLGADAANYIITQPTSLAANITQATIGVTGVAAVNKVYDATIAASLNNSSAALSGILGTDTVTLDTTSAAALFADKNVGTAKTVTASGYALLGADAANYTITQPTSLTANITQATIGVTGVAAVNKVYDATIAASLNNTSAALSGILGTDTVTLDTTSAAALFADKNVGTAKTVTASGYALLGADAANYTITQPTSLAANITQATIGVTGVAAVNKVYDATIAASLNNTSAALSGILGTDTVTLDTTSAAALFANKNVGTAKTVTASGYALLGADAANYTITQPTSLTANITQATIGVTGVAAVNKVYDATIAASLNNTSAALSGILGTDTVTLDTTSAAALFADKNVGTAKTVTASGYALLGADAANYIITQPTSLAANITQATIGVTGVAAVNKVYDATIAASLNNTSAALSGILGTDTVTLDTTAAAALFADKNVGTAKTVTASGYALLGADAANYIITQPTSLAANITQATIGVTGVAAVNKVYDATIAASLNNSSAALSGILGTDTVTLDTTAAAALFADKNVGTAKTVTASGYALLGADAANYIITQPTSLAANITQATIGVTGVAAVNKVYDATIAASLNNSSAALSGILGTDTVTLDTTAAAALFADKNVGTAKTVTASGYALLGADAANYIITQPTSLAANITQATIGVTGVAAVNKVYDATIAASLNNSSAALSGILGTDTVTLDTTAAAALFADKNVGTAKTVTASGYALLGADAANYIITQPTSLAAITPKETSYRVLDGQSSYGLYPTFGTTTFSGVFASDSVQGIYALTSLLGEAVAISHAIPMGSYVQSVIGLGGRDGGNYVLVPDYNVTGVLSVVFNASAFNTAPTSSTVTNVSASESPTGTSGTTNAATGSTPAPVTLQAKLTDDNLAMTSNILVNNPTVIYGPPAGSSTAQNSSNTSTVVNATTRHNNITTSSFANNASANNNEIILAFSSQEFSTGITLLQAFREQPVIILNIAPIKTNSQLQGSHQSDQLYLRTRKLLPNEEFFITVQDNMGNAKNITVITKTTHEEASLEPLRLF